MDEHDTGAQPRPDDPRSAKRAMLELVDIFKHASPGHADAWDAILNSIEGRLALEQFCVLPLAPKRVRRDVIVGIESALENRDSAGRHMRPRSDVAKAAAKGAGLARELADLIEADAQFWLWFSDLTPRLDALRDFRLQRCHEIEPPSEETERRVDAEMVEAFRDLDPAVAADRTIYRHRDEGETAGHRLAITLRRFADVVVERAPYQFSVGQPGRTADGTSAAERTFAVDLCRWFVPILGGPRHEEVANITTAVFHRLPSGASVPGDVVAVSQSMVKSWWNQRDRRADHPG